MTTLEVPSYENALVPDDTYLVELLEFSEPQSGDFGSYTFMRVKIVDGEYAEEEISTAASMKLSPKAKLYGFLEAFMGRSPEPKERIDLSAIAAQHPKAKAVVITRAKSDGTQLSVVEKLMKVAPTRPRSRPTPIEVTAEDEEAF